MTNGKLAMFHRHIYLRCLILTAVFAGHAPASSRGDEWVDLSNQESKLRDAGKYAEAEKIARRLLEMSQNQGSDIRIAASLELLGLAVSEQGHNDEAEKLLTQSLDMWRQLKNYDAPVAEVLGDIGWVYDKQGRFVESEKMFQQALEMLQRVYGPEHQSIAGILNNLGNANWHFADYTKALDYYERAKQMQVKLLGADSPEVGKSLNNIGFVYYSQGKYAEAESYHRKALAIREKALGPEHPDVADSLNNLADMCLQQGRYAEAEPMHERALRIREKVLGPDHPDVAWSLQNLGSLYADQGKYAQAEAFQQRALRIRERALGPNHFFVALSLDQLSKLYEQEGNDTDAARLRLRELQINEKAFGPDHPDVALALANLSFLYIKEKKYAEAESLAQRALKIREAKFGHENEFVAESLMGMAISLGEQQKFAEAEALARQVLEIREKVLVPEHTGIAGALNFLGWLKLKQNQFAEAKPYFQRTIAILEKSNVDPDLLYHCYRNRAELLWKTKQVEPSLADLTHALQILETLRTNVSGGEKERADFLADNSRAYEEMVAWQIELGHVNEALAAVERCRSRTLIDQLKVQGTDLLAGLSADEAKKLNNRDTAARAKVAALEQQLDVLPKRKDYSDEQKKAEETRLTSELTTARQEQIDAYRAIRNASPVYRLMLGQDFKPVEIGALQGWVKEQNALLLQYFLGEDAGFLFVISPDAPPQIVKLEIAKDQAEALGAEAGPLTAKQMKAALTLSGQDLPQRMTTAEKDEAMTARLAALWKFLVPEAQREALTTGKYGRLILVPDGALVNLPFETLVLEPGDNPVYFIDRGPPIVEGSSATLLFNLSQREAASTAPNNKQSVLTVGNPNYPSQPKNASNASRSANSTSRGSNDVLASFRPGARYATRGSLSPLPHSGTEVSWVAEAFSKNGLNANKLLKADATEANLRANAPGKAILHLACHGLVDAEHGNFFGALALTPGAKAGSNPADDGFLTLPEIYELNLKGCELAILSACQTNYGPEQRGEGVWALSRGFLVAGSRRVVASNWLVDDEAAASLVYIFCSQVAQQEKAAADQADSVDYAKALHDAKLWVRRQPKWQHPYYWATFTLIGPK
jgi:CHAT domain-containing protein/Tfp pilus assembly protein PilF